MKKLLAFLLVLSLLMTWGAAVHAEESEPEVFTEGDYKYIIQEDGSAEITGYTGKVATLVIPPILNGKTVTRIGDAAFFNCRELSEVSLPDSLTSMGDNPFSSCEKLISFLVSPDHSYLATIDGVLFSKPDKRLICYPCALHADSYLIPTGINLIGKNAFSRSTLKSITIPDSVTSIGEMAFNHCSELKRITIPDSVKSIGDFAFYYCSRLTRVMIPDGVENIGLCAFAVCSGLTEISLPESVTFLKGNPFVQCKKLASIWVSPDHPYLEVIDGALLSKPDKRLICSPCSLHAVSYVIPAGTKMIEANAFSYSQFKNIIIPDSVTDIGRYAFNHCDNLTITVGRDSYAKQYCEEHNLKYTYPDANDWLNAP